MPSATYFAQECPTCGRQLRIRVEYLGKRVACQHCQGTFVAAEASTLRGEAVDQGSALMRRANELLDSVARRQLTGHPPASR